MYLRECPRCTTEIVETDHAEQEQDGYVEKATEWTCPNCGRVVWLLDNQPVPNPWHQIFYISGKPGVQPSESEGHE